MSYYIYHISYVVLTAQQASLVRIQEYGHVSQQSDALHQRHEGVRWNLLDSNMKEKYYPGTVVAQYMRLLEVVDPLSIPSRDIEGHRGTSRGRASGV